MLSRIRGLAGAGLLGALLLATPGGAALAHDEGCELALRAAPIEEVPPLPGWTWREFVIGEDGWTGWGEWAGGDLRAATFTIACVIDPAGLFERRAQVRRAGWSEELELESTIGDEAAAWRSGRTAATHLEWRSGGTVGEIVGEWNANLGELAAMAAAFDSTVSSGVAAAPEVER